MADTDKQENTHNTELDAQKQVSKELFIIGIGASAGGLQALSALFSSVPNDSVAYVIVQHLSSDHRSFLKELLTPHSILEIVEAKPNLLVETNKVYVIPNDKELTIKDNQLQLTEKLHPDRSKTVDTFFKSLAEDKGHRAIGVILSGTGTDGSEGIMAIKKAGGMVIVQDPKSARFDGMPRNAINSGCADFVLEPELMPDEIFNYVKISPLANEMTELVNKDNESTYYLILDMVHNRTGIDFSNYKRPTIIRRISRRMVNCNVTTLSDYLDYLNLNMEEIEVLSKELEDDLNNYFRSTDIGQIFVDKSLIIRKYTPAAARLINLLESDIGRSMYQISNNLRYDHLIEDIKQVIINSTTIEKELQDQNGVWHQMRILPYISQERETDGAIVIFIKINELKSLHLMMEGILNSSPNSIIALKSIRNQRDIIEDYRIRVVNYKAQELLGRSQDELVGETLLNVWPGLLEQGVFERLALVVEKGKMLDIEHSHLLNRKQCWIQLSAVKFDDGLVLTIHNITERKHYEQELKSQKEENIKSANRFRTLLEAFPHITWTNKPTGETESFNRTWFEYTGLTHEESIDWGWTKAVHPQDLNEIMNDYKKSLQAGTVFHAQGRILRKSDNQYHWHLIKDVPLRDEEGNIYLWIGTAIDIQFYKEAEETNIQLRLSQHREILKTNLQTQETERKNISEALHNGLGQILYATKLNLDQLNPKGIKEKELLEKVNRYLEESIKVTRNISFELTPSVLKDFGLKAGIKEMVARFSSPNLKIAVSIKGFDQRVEDFVELSIYRILQEILNNIIKHSKATIASIELNLVSNIISLIVKDNGIGFDKNELKSKKGLGLISIKNRLELLNGKLGIDSKEGKGTTYKLECRL